VALGAGVAAVVLSAGACDGSDIDPGLDAQAGSRADATSGAEGAAPDAISDASDASDGATDTLSDGSTLDAADGDGGGCITDLTDVGTGDFHIAFQLQTSATKLSTLLFQRGICLHSEFWDIHLLSSGKIGVELDNSGANYTVLNSSRTVNDGAAHTIVVARVSLDLSITIDGVVDTSTLAHTDFGYLPPLGIASGSTCEGSSNGEVALKGTLTALCITTP
jgi:hypothetical protein